MLSRISVKKPYYVVVGIILVLVLGVISFTRMTTDLLPSMNFPYVIVYVTDPGATPEQIEADITRPMESSFSTLTDIKNISSQSRDSLSLIVLQFNDTADMNTAMIEINSDITALQADWPDGVGAPVILKINPDLMPVSIVSVSRDDMDILELSRYVSDTLIPKYESLNGVARVSASGLITEEVDITIEQDRIDILNSAILRDVDEELADVERQLNDAQAQISDGKAMLASQKRKILGQLNSAQKMLDGADEQMAGTVEELKTQRADLQTQLTQVDQAITQLESLPTLTDEQKELVRRLRTELGELEAQKADLVSQLEKIREQSGTDSLNGQIAELESHRADLVRERGTLENYIQDLKEADSESILADIVSLRAQLDTAEAERTTAEETLNARQAELEDAKAQIQSLKDQIAAREGAQPTSVPTEAATEAPTDSATQTASEAPTDAATEAASEAPTDAATEAVTETPTEGTTDDPTETAADAQTLSPTDAATDTPAGETADTPSNASEGSTDAPQATDADAGIERPAEAESAEASEAFLQMDDLPEETEAASPTDTIDFFDETRSESVWTPFFAAAEERSLEDLRRDLAEAEAGLPTLEADVEKAKAALDEKQSAVERIQAELSAKEEALEGVQSGDLSSRISAAEKEIESLDTRISSVDLEIEGLRQLGQGEGSAAQAILERIAELDWRIDEIRSSDAYRALELILDEDQRAQQYAQAVEGKAQLEAGIAQLDQAIEKLEAGVIPGGTIEGFDEDMTIAEAKSKLSSARSMALSAFSDAEAQLNDASAQLAEARKEFEDKREEAYEQAGLDGVITLETVAGLIGAQNISMPAGYVYDANEEQFMVRVGDKFESLEQLRRQKLFSLGLDSVDEIRLTDVARVEITDDRDDNFTKVDGLDGILLSIEKQSTYSTTDVSERVNARSASLMQETPGLHIVDMFNQGDYINIIVDSVLNNLVWGGLLAILVLLIFLFDWRPTLIVAMSIPLSVVIAFVCMYFTHITLNVLSLSGLALGIGMLVDNSIVSIENIFRLHNEEKAPILHACVQGINQVGGALFASTLTTVCVFLPVVFVSGMAHDLFVDLGLTITYSLMASLLVAMTVVPSMAAGLMRKNRMDRQNGLFARFQAGYVALLRGSLRVKPLVLLASVALLVFCALRVPSMGISFMPQVNSTQMTATYTLDEDGDEKEQQQAALALMEDMMTIQGIETVGLTGGSGIGTLMGGSNALTYYIIVSEDSGRSNVQIARDIQAFADKRQMDLSVETSTMDISMLTGSGISIDITGEDTDVLASTARDVAQIVRGVSGTTEVSDGLEKAVPQIRITVDKEAAADKGLTAGQVLQLIATKLAGKTEMTQVTFDGNDMSVYIVDGRNQDLRPDDLMKLEIEVTSGDKSEMVLVGEIADIEEAEGFSTIRRDAQKRVVSVSFQAAEGESINLLSDRVEEALDSYTLPEGYEIALSGENESVMEIMRNLIFMVAVAILLIFLIMVGQFQSFKSPFIVMFTIPLAFTGGLLALMITGMDLSIVAMIGFLVLSGVIVNNGIVFVDTVNQLRMGGMGKKDALIEAGRLRLRPILMTALTTILGMSTMALGTGMGAEMMQPMAVVVVGGLLYATLMTLFVVPCLYDLFNGERMSVRAMRMAEEAAGLSGESEEVAPPSPMPEPTEQRSKPRHILRRKGKKEEVPPVASMEPPKATNALEETETFEDVTATIGTDDGTTPVTTEAKPEEAAPSEDAPVAPEKDLVHETPALKQDKAAPAPVQAEAEQAPASPAAATQQPPQKAGGPQDMPGVDAYGRQAASPYGQPVNAYGQPVNAYGQPAANPYGQPVNPYVQPVSNPYVQPVNAYGQPVANPYGQPVVNAYGAPTGAYAQPVVNTYGQPVSAYGQPMVNAYGQPVVPMQPVMPVQPMAPVQPAVYPQQQAAPRTQQAKRAKKATNAGSRARRRDRVEGKLER